MRKLVLLTIALVTLAITEGSSQVVHPISTAYITPNPAEGKAELMFEEPVMEQVTVVVKDLTGHLVFTAGSQMPGEACKSISLDIERLTKGIYICQVTGSSGKVKTLKFQKT